MQIPKHELLEAECTAHLDAAGFRYYIPALMLTLIENYDNSSMRDISTLMSLYPKPDRMWTYHMVQYSLLNYDQKQAIAKFLIALPDLVTLDTEDKAMVELAIRNYWSEFLPTYISTNDELENI